MGTAAHLREWLGARGWWARLSRVVRRGGTLPASAEKQHPFDRKYRVDTDGLIYADADAVGHAGARHNAGYYATAPSLFQGAVELWRDTLAGTGYGVEDYALVDIGCGKGRVLMMAAEYPFRKVVGVELDPGLAEVARRNLSRVGRRRWLGLRGPRLRASDIRRVRIVEGDALGMGDRSTTGGAERGIDDGPVVLFYFNSFELPMMEMWLARLGEIARGRTHPLDLIYVHPEFNTLVRQVPGMRSLAEAEIAFSEEDAGADVFGVSEDRTAVYRLNR